MFFSQMLKDHLFFLSKTICILNITPLTLSFLILFTIDQLFIQTSLMQTSRNKDIFGYENQGIKYELYRPNYPTHLLTHVLSKVPTHHRYIDIATGTGKILAQISPSFSHAQALDISTKMLDVCSQVIKDKNLKNTKIICENFMGYTPQHKYDLITIGQALHWFPIRSFISKSKELLTEKGVFAVYGYILDGVQTDDEEQNKKLKSSFQEFYDKRVKINHDFNVDDLHSQYGNKEKYPFEEFFPKVTRKTIKALIQMSKTELILYVRTFSGYNTYLERFPKQEDPILILQRGIPENLKIRSIFYYFSIECSD